MNDYNLLAIDIIYHKDENVYGFGKDPISDKTMGKYKTASLVLYVENSVHEPTVILLGGAKNFDIMPLEEYSSKDFVRENFTLRNLTQELTPLTVSGNNTKKISAYMTIGNVQKPLFEYENDKLILYRSQILKNFTRQNIAYEPHELNIPVEKNDMELAAKYPEFSEKDEIVDLNELINGDNYTENQSHLGSTDAVSFFNRNKTSIQIAQDDAAKEAGREAREMYGYWEDVLSDEECL